jgi:hypothetical protein
MPSEICTHEEVTCPQRFVYKRTIEFPPVILRTIEFRPVILRTIEFPPVILRTIEFPPVILRTIEFPPVILRTVEFPPVILRTLEFPPVVLGTMELLQAFSFEDVTCYTHKSSFARFAIIFPRFLKKGHLDAVPTVFEYHCRHLMKLIACSRLQESFL